MNANVVAAGDVAGISFSSTDAIPSETPSTRTLSDVNMSMSGTVNGIRARGIIFETASNYCNNLNLHMLGSVEGSSFFSKGVDVSLSPSAVNSSLGTIKLFANGSVSNSDGNSNGAYLWLGTSQSQGRGEGNPQSGLPLSFVSIEDIKVICEGLCFFLASICVGGCALWLIYFAATVQSSDTAYGIQFISENPTLKSVTLELGGHVFGSVTFFIFSIEFPN